MNSILQQTGCTDSPANEVAQSAIIRTRNLQKRYIMGGSTVHALRGIDLEIARGEFCSIMGPSGSGKSTLMNVIGCLDAADGGDYWLNGKQVRNLSDRQLARIRNKAVGFVFQTFNLMPNATALQNVEMPLIYAGMKSRERRRKAGATLGQVGLADRIWHKPGELSGGQRQRVAIARAMVMEPNILLADEPTGNLDSTTAIEIMRLFKSLHMAGNTIVLVTHDQTIARNADRILNMFDGRIVSDSKKDFR
jgi:putative ABC transport system ATP-binding protein